MVPLDDPGAVRDEMLFRARELAKRADFAETGADALCKALAARTLAEAATEITSLIGAEESRERMEALMARNAGGAAIYPGEDDDDEEDAEEDTE